ncbi:MAG: hypothetical protein OEV33_06335, partial [Armatimonadota bacterium]|nr:hypothetical protein [Armatimonadota bacterium]
LVVLMIALALAGCGQSANPTPEADSAEPAAPEGNANPPQEGAATQSNASAYEPPSDAPTYSDVVATYAKDVELCKTEATIEGVSDDGNMLCGGTFDIRNNKTLVRWYGAKVTVSVEVELGGKTYQPGAKLTVDKNLNWIEVSSWD